MAYLAPIAVVVVGAHDRVVMLWVKIIRESRGASRRARRLTPAADVRTSRAPSGPGPIVAAWSEAGRSSPCRSPTSAALWPSSASRRPSRPCSSAAVSAIPTAARAFLEPEGITHDPLLLGDMAAAVERIRAAVERGETDLRPRRLRRRRHLRDGARGPDAERARRRRHLAPAEPVRGGLRRLGRDDRAPRRGGRQADPHGRLRDHRRRPRSSEARRLGVDMIVTDHHRPGETLPDCPIVATRPSDYPFPDLCGTGVVVKLAQALLGADHPAVARHADLVALATIADVVPLVDENRALATTGLRGLVAHPEARAAGADARRRRRPGDRRRDRGRLPARAAPQRGGTAGTARRRPAPRPHARTRARPTCSRTSSRRSTATARPSRSGSSARRSRSSTAWPPEKRSAPRLRRVGRGLARGRDRHRRLAARRALRPPGRADRRRGRRAGRAPAARSRASTSTPASPPAPSTSSASAAIVPPPGLTIRAEQLEPFAAAFAAHADGELVDEDLAPVTRIDAIVPGSGAHARPRPRARAAGAVRSRQPRRDAARRRRARRSAPRPSARASTCASACASTGATRAARSRSGSAAQLERLRARVALRRRVQAQAEPLERDRRAAARRPARLRHARTPTRSCARGSPSCGGRARPPGRPRRGGSSPSSRSTTRAGSGSCSSRRRSGRCSRTARRSRCRRPRRRRAPQRAPRGACGRGRAVRRPRDASVRSSSASSRSTRRRSRYLRKQSHGPRLFGSPAPRSCHPKGRE